VTFLAVFLCVFASLREEYLAEGLSRILLTQRRKDAKELTQARQFLDDAYETLGAVITPILSLDGRQ
jgi:hypothetical protein